MTLPVPTLMSASVGAILTAAQWNSNVRDGIGFAIAPPIFRGHASINQSVASSGGTGAAIALDVNDVDTYNGHSTTVNNSDYTSQVTGWYLVLGTMHMASGGTGERAIQLIRNGTTVNQVEVNATTADSTALEISVADIVFLQVGWTVRLGALQNSGGAINLLNAPAFGQTSSMTVLWVHS